MVMPGCAPQGASYIREDELDVILSAPDCPVLRSLRGNGDDPECLREIDHVLCPDPTDVADPEKRAALIYFLNSTDGWVVEDATQGDVRARTHAMTTAQALAEQIQFLSGAGALFGFAHDDWETRVTPDCGA